MKELYKRSVEHLHDVQMSYGTHWWRSMTFAYHWACGAVCAVVHAFVPAWYETATTERLARMTRMVG